MNQHRHECNRIPIWALLSSVENIIELHGRKEAKSYRVIMRSEHFLGERDEPATVHVLGRYIRFTYPQSGITSFLKFCCEEGSGEFFAIIATEVAMCQMGQCSCEGSHVDPETDRT